MATANATTSTMKFDPDRALALHPLVYVPNGDQVAIGRADIDSYAIVDPDGAALIRRLGEGATPRSVAAWYESEYGETVDVGDLVASLHELGFVRSGNDAPPHIGSLRWRRLGAAIFSWPALMTYATLVVWAVVASVRRPDLLPNYHHVFFTDYYAVVQVVLFLVAVPQLLLHEAFHALAGRRLGLRSRLKIGRRLYFLVLETSMDGLVGVPRRQRYLPILAGMMADAVVASVLTIVADVSRAPNGSFSLLSRICLAAAMTVCLRIVWQFFFYLRTDMYMLISTAMGCVDLDAAAKGLLRNRVYELLGRRHRVIDESHWHPVDVKAARWYSWLIVVGYTVSILTFGFAVGPIVLRMFIGVAGRFGGSDVPWPQMLDSAVVSGFLLIQLSMLIWLTLRERRARPTS